MDPEPKLVTYTALAIVADEQIEQIQEIRQKHDPAYPRWPPHINLCFPFVPPQVFQQFYESLSEQFADFEQFQITFTEISSFGHGTIFLVPNAENNKIHEVFQRIINKHPELRNKEHKEFNPHMTVAKVKKHEIENRKMEFQQTWKEWKIRCKGLHMMARDKNTPFKTLNMVAFKKKQE